MPHNDLMKYFRKDLHRRLLSSDFKKQIDGIEMLHKLMLTLQALPSIEKEIVEILDILLRWFVLRFCESNTTCLLKIVGQLKSLQLVASLTAERDGEIWKAALNTLATGDDIWRYVRKLTEAQRSMLDDRFKWKDQGLEVISEGLDKLKDMARDLNEVDNAASDLKNTNVRLKDTVNQVIKLPLYFL
ncbi:Protein MOR1 [Camellia lanceoleosa]|uniref:Protein MOR1 n=1 Tax=Camellia lanceoleosa TaxID=1840588 RepID=A0ACC0IRI6_9ERIC|nr:Protein MOR1 [Camellia lanceoleosa]